MKARQLIDRLHEEAATVADYYTKLVAEIFHFLDNGNLSDTAKTTDLIQKAKQLSLRDEDPDHQEELRRLAAVLDGHRKYYAADSSQD